jgi:transcription antitermination factor NusG
MEPSALHGSTYTCDNTDLFDSTHILLDVEEEYPISSIEYCYCVQVHAVEQFSVIKRILLFFPCKVINPIINRRIWIGKEYRIVTCLLMPGYIFLFSIERMEPYTLGSIQGVSKILQYSNGAYALTDGDEEFARWLLKYNGTIGLSHAVKEGDWVNVIQGPLADKAGKIVLMNRKRKRAKVELVFSHSTWHAWLDFDFIEPKILPIAHN